MHISGIQPSIFPAQEKPYSRARRSEVLEESLFGADPCHEANNACLFGSASPIQSALKFASNACPLEILSCLANTSIHNAKSFCQLRARTTKTFQPPYRPSTSTVRALVCRNDLQWSRARNVSLLRLLQNS